MGLFRDLYWVAELSFMQLAASEEDMIAVVSQLIKGWGKIAGLQHSIVLVSSSWPRLAVLRTG